MALSGETSFNPDVADLLDEAYDRAGLDVRSGYDMISGRRSVQYLTLEWAAKGINLWTFEKVLWSDPDTSSEFLIAGQEEYRIALDTIGVTDIFLRINDGDTATQADYRLNRLAAAVYGNIPNKLSTGRPLQYYTDRHEIKDVTAGVDRFNTLTLWPVPEQDNFYKLLYWRLKRMDDPGSKGTNTLEIPDRFIPAFVSGLAYHIARKSKNPNSYMRKNDLKIDYDFDFQEAAGEDRERSNYRATPWNYKTRI